MQRIRPNPRLLLFSFAGNIAFIGSWLVVLRKPSGWLALSIALLATFLVLRVGGAWWQVRQAPAEATAHFRRAAVITTVLAMVAVGLWTFSVIYGARQAPRVERRVEQPGQQL